MGGAVVKASARRDGRPDDDIATPNSPPPSLRFQVADRLELIQEAWGLVYRTYRNAALINENPHGVHTTAQLLGPHIAVVLGRIHGATASTVTCIRDHDAELPLASTYGYELEAMRRDGAKLTEVGLLADRRTDMARTVDSLFMLMHYAYDFAFMDGGTDMIIGVHPRHSGFYTRAFGFVVSGPERTYARVNDHPVVLLRLNRRLSDAPDTLPRGLRFFRENPLNQNEFRKRYQFDGPEVAESPVGRFVRDRTRGGGCGVASGV